MPLLVHVLRARKDAVQYARRRGFNMPVCAEISAGTRSVLDMKLSVANGNAATKLRAGQGMAPAGRSCRTVMLGMLPSRGDGNLHPTTGRPHAVANLDQHQKTCAKPFPLGPVRRIMHRGKAAAGDMFAGVAVSYDAGGAAEKN